MRKGLFLVGLFALALISYKAWAYDPTINYTTITKTATASSAQTDATLWDPAADHRIILQGCTISSFNAIVVELEVSDVDVVPPIYITSLGTVTIGGGENPIYVGEEDAVLTYTTSLSGTSPAHKSVSIMCWGWENKVG